MKGKYFYIYRDAQTGKFVSKEYAQCNESTTVKHKVERASVQYRHSK
jgi:hypothetical protein